MSRGVVVIGVGNAFRGDDAAGLAIADRVVDLGQQNGIEVLSHAGESLGLLELWTGATAVLLAESIWSGVAPGTIVRVDASSDQVPSAFEGFSSHAFGIAQAVELSRTLGTLPPTAVVFGVEGASYELGAPLSQPVLAAIDSAADLVRRCALALVAP